MVSASILLVNDGVSAYQHHEIGRFRRLRSANGQESMEVYTVRDDCQPDGETSQEIRNDDDWNCKSRRDVV